jgi:hypothetical protein
VPQLLSGYRGKRGSRESGMPHVRLDLRPHPGLPLASFAVSRDFLVLGEQCLTRRARSREGCSVPSRSLFALFAASREPSVQGENNVSREGREAAKDAAFPSFPSSRSSRLRVSLRYREGITSHAKSTKSRRMYFLLTIGTLRASRVIFQYRERTMSHAKPRKNVEILVIAPKKKARAPSGEGGLLHW